MSDYPPSKPAVGECPYCNGPIDHDGITGNLHCRTCNRKWQKV